MVTPIDGVILKLARDADGQLLANGQLVSLGQLVAQIAPLDALIADVDLIGDDIAARARGARSARPLPRLGRHAVRRQGPAARADGRSAHARVARRGARSTTRSNGLRPGMFVEVTLIGERRENVPVVPRSAVTDRGGRRVVFVLASQRVAMREVTLGLGDDVFVEVRRGLEAGERVVVRGLETLHGPNARSRDESLASPAAMEALARVATRRPVAVTVLAAVVVVLGFVSWRGLPLDLLPDVESPTVLISVSLGRAAGRRDGAALRRAHRAAAVHGAGPARDQPDRALGRADLARDLRLGHRHRLRAGRGRTRRSRRSRPTPTSTRCACGASIRGSCPCSCSGSSRPRGKPISPICGASPSARSARRSSSSKASRRSASRAGARSRSRCGSTRRGSTPTGSRSTTSGTASSAANVDVNAGTVDRGRSRAARARARRASRGPRTSPPRSCAIRTTGAEGVVPLYVSDLGEVVLADADITHVVRVDGVEGVGLSVYKEAGANTVAVSRVVRDAFAATRGRSSGAHGHHRHRRSRARRGRDRRASSRPRSSASRSRSAFCSCSCAAPGRSSSSRPPSPCRCSRPCSR